MDKKKDTFQVIIAHPVPEESQRIAALLEQNGLFRVCYATHNGEDCLSQTVLLEPDLVIVHAVLEGIDGLEVLQKLAKLLPQDTTKRLYITSYNSYLNHYAALDGVDHCILLPCSDELLLRRAVELLLPPQLSATDEEIDACTMRILHNIGASRNKKGYYYAVDAVRVLVRDPELVVRRVVTTELYGGIAKKHKLKNAQQVERCLRTLTDRIFMHGSIQSLRQYFSAADIQRSRIKNTVFLTTIAKRVTDALQGETEGNGHKGN